MKDRDERRGATKERSLNLSRLGEAVKTNLDEFLWAIEQLKLLERVSDSFPRKEEVRQQLNTIVGIVDDPPPFEEEEAPSPVDDSYVVCEYCSLFLENKTASTPVFLSTYHSNHLLVVLQELSNLGGWLASLASHILTKLLSFDDPVFQCQVLADSAEPKGGNVSHLNSHESPGGKYCYFPRRENGDE